jgi:uncharacterized membrane protein
MERFWEIDFLRGVAVILMVISNFVTDLDFFHIYSANSVFWWLFARLTAFMFIFLAGLSLALSYSKKRQFRYFFFRGMKIFSWGILITIVTFLFIPKYYVRFGVLHLIGLSIILSYPFMRLKKEIIILAAAAITGAGIYLSNFTFSFPWLLWIGFLPSSFYSVDYFPLMPWFGIILLGIFTGNLIYPKGKRNFKIWKLNNSMINFLAFLGRNSLKIYLTHQPVIIGLLAILLKVSV